tara:strand:- start:25 stop:348 length:324 start_codon:yes stop_codon:yes gene_type:complete
MSSILCEFGGLYSRVFCFQRRLNEGSALEEIRTELRELGLYYGNPLKSPQGKALYFIAVYSLKEGETEKALPFFEKLSKDSISKARLPFVMSSESIAPFIPSLMSLA